FFHGMLVLKIISNLHKNVPLIYRHSELESSIRFYPPLGTSIQPPPANVRSVDCDGLRNLYLLRIFFKSGSALYLLPATHTHSVDSIAYFVSFFNLAYSS